MTVEKTHKIKESTLNNILNFLSEAPYKQVVGLIQQVTNDLQAGQKAEATLRKVEEKAEKA